MKPMDQCLALIKRFDFSEIRMAGFPQFSDVVWLHCVNIIPYYVLAEITFNEADL